MIINIKKIKKISFTLCVNAIAILTLSLISIYTTTAERTMNFFYKEAIFAIVGIFVYIFFSLIDYRNYFKYTKLIYIFNVAILSLVFLIGTKRLGAQRWIDLKVIVIQPSEFAKLFIVLTFSEFLINKYSMKKSNGFKKMIMSFLHILPIFLLIAKQPDLGTSLTLICIYCVVIFIHGLDWRAIFITVIGSLASLPFFYTFFLKDYQKQRVMTFLNPEADKLGSGWNVTQSKIAIGSGGFLGKGLFNSTQSKLRFLPESHTDFIGSVFLEETGFVGGVILLTLYVTLLINIIDIADKSRDEYGKLICYGIVAVFFFHIFVNLGMIMGIMPVTGLPLLFMSYGGSSLIFSFMMLGIVQSVKVYRD